jgi:hypothetical protein
MIDEGDRSQRVDTCEVRERLRWWLNLRLWNPASLLLPLGSLVPKLKWLLLLIWDKRLLLISAYVLWHLLIKQAGFGASLTKWLQVLLAKLCLRLSERLMSRIASQCQSLGLIPRRRSEPSFLVKFIHKSIRHIHIVFLGRLLRLVRFLLREVFAVVHLSEI